MVKFKSLVAFGLVLFMVQPSFATDPANVLGIWKLVSYDWEVKSTGERQPIMGKVPMGYITFTKEGLMMAIITGEGRTAPKTDQDRSQLFRSMIAYSGRYRFEGDKWITKVDVAWHPERVGTEQERFFKLNGDRLEVLTPWMPRLNVKPEEMGRAILTWERVK